MILLQQGPWSVHLESGRIAFRHKDGGMLVSPHEGYWNIACAWHGERPEAWHHAPVTAWEAADDGIRLDGQVRFSNGICECHDSLEFCPDGLLQIRRRWHYRGEALVQVTLACRFQRPEPFADILLPGILYYGNPSGGRAPGIPVMPKRPGSRLLLEEHRYPIPFAVSESAGIAAAFHTVPSPVPRASRPDLWWSLGAEYLADATELAAYSGYLSINGRDGFIKARQKEFLPCPSSGMTLTDGMIVEKTFSIQLVPGCVKGSGFRPALDAALRRWPVHTLPIDPAQLIRRKYRYAVDHRFYRQGKVAGALFNTPENSPPSIVFGWCGRSEVLGFALPVLGEACGDPDARRRADECFDFLASSPVAEEGFCVEYDITSGAWSDRNFVSQGQALEAFVRGIKLRRDRGEPIPAPWLAFLKKVCGSWSRRVMKPSWRPVATGEAFLAAPLVLAGTLLNAPKFITAARKIADHCIARHSSMDEPYWGGTLDASCEDKEAAAAAMSAFFAVWEATRNRRYLDAAEHATAVYLTYLQCWDIPMPPGRLADHFFRSAGWTAVSVQNMHLDVYGVWVAPLLWKIADALGNDTWKRLALPMLINCGQLTDIHGKQGEQIEQTNFSQRPCREAESITRGGYAENWAVFWITAAFLSAAAEFALLGIDLLSPRGGSAIE